MGVRVSSADVVKALKVINVIGEDVKDRKQIHSVSKQKMVYRVTDKVSSNFDEYIDSKIDERFRGYNGVVVQKVTTIPKFVEYFFYYYKLSLYSGIVENISVICKNKDVQKVIDLFMYIEDIGAIASKIKSMSITSSKEELLKLKEMYSIYAFDDSINAMVKSEECKHSLLCILRGAIDILLILHCDYLKEDLINGDIAVVFSLGNCVVIGSSDKNLLKDSVRVYLDYYSNTLVKYDEAFNKGGSRFEIDNILRDYILRGVISYDISESKGDYLSGIPDASKKGHTKITSVTESYYTKRKVLMPSKGVVILVEDKESIIESIYLRELSLEDTHNLVITAKYKDGSEITNKVPLVLNSKRVVLIHKKEEIDIEEYIDDFLGIKRTNGLNYTVISPYYWRYRNKGYVSKGDKVIRGVVVKREVEVDIAPFLRRANSCSNSAIVYAKTIGLDLPKGYTIVKPHKRVYNKVTN